MKIAQWLYYFRIDIYEKVLLFIVSWAPAKVRCPRNESVHQVVASPTMRHLHKLLVIEKIIFVKEGCYGKCF